MDPETPLISVIIPVFNGQKFIADAVASVRKQQYDRLEIIVVDDASTDTTIQIVESLDPPVMLLRQPMNTGQAAARNRGIAASHGSLLAFLDADDLWSDDKLTLQLPLLLNNPDLDVVHAHLQMSTLHGEPYVLERLTEGPLLNVSLGAGLYRRKVFEQLGPLDETLRFGEDQDWFLRLREAGIKMVVIPQVTLMYRLHGANITNPRNAIGSQRMAILRNSVRRRREMGKEDQQLPSLSDYKADADAT